MYIQRIFNLDFLIKFCFSDYFLICRWWGHGIFCICGAFINKYHCLHTPLRKVKLTAVSWFAKQSNFIAWVGAQIKFHSLFRQWLLVMYPKQKGSFPLQWLHGELRCFTELNLVIYCLKLMQNRPFPKPFFKCDALEQYFLK